MRFCNNIYCLFLFFLSFISSSFLFYTSSSVFFWLYYLFYCFLYILVQSFLFYLLQIEKRKEIHIHVPTQLGRGIKTYPTFKSEVHNFKYFDFSLYLSNTRIILKFILLTIILIRVFKDKPCHFHINNL